MASSHLNRLRNEIKDLEEKSDKKVPEKSYYITHISFSGSEVPESILTNWGKEIALNKKHRPLFVYIRFGSIFMCYSPGAHMFRGSHQKICSYYCSYYTAKLNQETQVVCSLTEFSTPYSVFGYLSWKNVEVQFQHLARLLDLPIEKVYQKTLHEMLEQVKDQWETSSKFERYGTIYKLREKNGKVVLSSFSKVIDSRRRDHYLSYLFGKPEAH